MNKRDFKDFLPILNNKHGFGGESSDAEAAPEEDLSQSVPTGEGSPVQDFEPVPAEDPVPREPSATAATENAGDVISAEESDTKTRKGAGKATTPSKKKESAKKKRDDVEGKVKKAFYLKPENYMDIQMAAFLARINYSEYIENASTDSAKYTYTCSSANCRAEFTMRTTVEGEPSKPSVCPICGKNTVRIKKGR